MSLLEDDNERYKQSFYFWAAFVPQGFASVQLNSALLDKIHSYLVTEGYFSRSLNHDSGEMSTARCIHSGLLSSLVMKRDSLIEVMRSKQPDGMNDTWLEELGISPSWEDMIQIDM